jgi:hypothetical protein
MMYTFFFLFFFVFFKNVGVVLLARRMVMPTNTWKYVDTEGNTQGPFSRAQMIEWVAAGWFPHDTVVIDVNAGQGRPLASIPELNPPHIREREKVSEREREREREYMMMGCLRQCPH